MLGPPASDDDAQEIELFEDRPKSGVIDFGVWPEVGSRMLSRLLITESSVFEEGWMTVQEGR